MRDLLGESGSGKSVAMLAVMGLIRPPGRVSADVLRFNGRDLLALSPRARRQLVGKDLAMIFQEPMTSLNPCFTVGWQIGEALRVHLGLSRAESRARTIALLRQVGIPAPEQRLSAFPHLLSGGMNQRVMIAMAIACNPLVLIADEPTTALDVTIQQQILDLLAELQRQRDMALILITHDMAVIADTAHRVQVMYAGQTMEGRPADALLAAPAHPYTAALLAALPERADARRRLATIPGVVPRIADRPDGCLFAPRCQFAFARCRERPAPTRLPDGAVRCHAPL
jgi:dipeptide transport system ATP-binding protein